MGLLGDILSSSGGDGFGSSSGSSGGGSSGGSGVGSFIGAVISNPGGNGGYGSTMGPGDVGGSNSTTSPGSAGSGSGSGWDPAGSMYNRIAGDLASTGADGNKDSGSGGGWDWWNNPYSGGGYGGGSGGGNTSQITPEDLLNQEVYNPTDEDGNPTGDGNPYTYLANGAPSAYERPEIDGPNPERIEHVDTQELKDMLQQLVDLQKQQGEQQVDYSVQQGVNELNRAMADAAKQYETQRSQIAAEEARARDNQALYAEARGDRGGIGEAQYDSIANAAATNRRAVNDAQVKMGTDTARQIADLRAQGEFTKADQLLSLTQSHLAQLKDLEQWALQTNLGVDEFNSQLQQWVDEYNLKTQQYLSDLDLSAAQITGMFADGTRTMAAQQQLVESLVNSGNALLQAGVLPSRQQLEAMGLTEAQARAYLKQMGKDPDKKY